MRILAAALVVTFLAACDGPSGPSQAPSPDATEAAEPAESAAVPASRSSATARRTNQDVVTSVLAALDGKVKVRYDRMAENAGGNSERQVFMEVVAGTVDEAEAILRDQLTAAGYKTGHRFEDGNGARQLYRMRGGQPVRTLSRRKGIGPALKDPGAVGSIYLKQ